MNRRIGNFILAVIVAAMGTALNAASNPPTASAARFAPDGDGSAKGKGKSGRKRSSKPKKDGPAESGPFAQGDREKEFIKALGDEYKIRRTDHFFVLYNADEEVVKDFIHRLEQSYKSVHRFVTQQGIKIEYPDQKLPVLFCKDFPEYSRRSAQLTGSPAPSQAAGLYFRHPYNFSLFYDMSQVDFIKETTQKADKLRQEAGAAQDRSQKKQKLREAQWYLNQVDQYQQEQNRSVVQHEVAHQLLFNFHAHEPKVDNPQWFVEGMATLFEPPPGKSGAGFNVINQGRLGEIRDLLVNVSPDELKAFIGNPAPGGGMLSSEGYARSWALTYYLVKRKQKQLPKYFELIKKRSPKDQITPERDVADFEKCFGKVDATFAKKWSNYIRQLPFRPAQ